MSCEKLLPPSNCWITDYFVGYSSVINQQIQPRRKFERCLTPHFTGKNGANAPGATVARIWEKELLNATSGRSDSTRTCSEPPVRPRPDVTFLLGCFSSSLT